MYPPADYSIATSYEKASMDEPWTIYVSADNFQTPLPISISPGKTISELQQEIRAVFANYLRSMDFVLLEVNNMAQLYEGDLVSTILNNGTTILIDYDV